MECECRILADISEECTASVVRVEGVPIKPLASIGHMFLQNAEKLIPDIKTSYPSGCHLSALVCYCVEHLMMMLHRCCYIFSFCIFMCSHFSVYILDALLRNSVVKN
jgi:hypothetical protein